MTYKQLVQIAKETRTLFEKYEKKSAGKVWDNQQLFMGLVTDMGDLSKLILAKDGYRSLSGNVDKALRHELADCFWVLIILSEKYNINLPEALIEMNEEIKIKLKDYNK